MALPPREILIDMAEDLLFQFEPTTVTDSHQLSNLNDSDLLQLIERLQNPRQIPKEQPRLVWVSVD